MNWRNSAAERCKNNTVIVMGDFNFSIINWDFLSVRGLYQVEFVKCAKRVF